MRTSTKCSWALLAAVSGFLLGSSVGCIVVAAMATASPVEGAAILSTSQISMQMDRPITRTRIGVMTERLRTGTMTDRVRNDRVALVNLSDY